MCHSGLRSNPHTHFVLVEGLPVCAALPCCSMGADNRWGGFKLWSLNKRSPRALARAIRATVTIEYPKGGVHTCPIERTTVSPGIHNAAGAGAQAPQPLQLREQLPIHPEAQLNAGLSHCSLPDSNAVLLQLLRGQDSSTPIVPVGTGAARTLRATASSSSRSKAAAVMRSLIRADQSFCRVLSI